MKIQKKAIIFAIAGYTEPVFLRRRDEIILGRYVQGESQPTLDLTQFNGHLLGVSRRHASINFSGDDCTIQDLGSANGTWVNENALSQGERHPLNAGDQIRLGNLIIFVYFSTVDSVSLVDKESPADVPVRLTPRYLADRLVPFLQALADLQVVIDQIRGSDPPTITVNALSAGARESLSLKLAGASDALDVFQATIMPWKQRHAELINEVKANPEPEADAERTSRFENAQRLLIQSMMSKIAPLTNSGADSYFSQLTTPLRVLALSPLEISGPRQVRVASEQGEH